MSTAFNSMSSAFAELIKKYPAAAVPARHLSENAQLKKNFIAAGDGKNACKVNQSSLKYTIQLRSILPETEPIQQLATAAISQLNSLTHNCSIKKMILVEKIFSQKLKQML